MNREQLIRRGVMLMDAGHATPAQKSRRGLESLGRALMKSGGPFIGPRGGKWADPQHTIPWQEPSSSAPKAGVKREMLQGRGMVWRCSDCRSWADKGAIRHSKRCDLHGTPEAETYYPDAEESDVPTATAPKATLTPKPAGDPKGDSRVSQDAIRRHAKVGDLAVRYSDDEIQDAVKRGWITESDAMNQDF